jgi:hypothetical protein
MVSPRCTASLPRGYNDWAIIHGGRWLLDLADLSQKFLESALNNWLPGFSNGAIVTFDEGRHSCTHLPVSEVVFSRMVLIISLPNATASGNRGAKCFWISSNLSR